MAPSETAGAGRAVDVVRALMELTDAERAAVLMYMRDWCDECGQPCEVAGHFSDEHDHLQCSAPSADSHRVFDAIVQAVNGGAR